MCSEIYSNLSSGFWTDGEIRMKKTEEKRRGRLEIDFMLPPNTFLRTNTIWVKTYINTLDKKVLFLVYKSIFNWIYAKGCNPYTQQVYKGYTNINKKYRLYSYQASQTYWQKRAEQKHSSTQIEIKGINALSLEWIFHILQNFKHSTHSKCTLHHKRYWGIAVRITMLPHLLTLPCQLAKSSKTTFSII